MRVKDLQEFLSKFTEANATGTRQGNAISNAIIFVEVNGELREIRRMEVHEHLNKQVENARKSGM